MMPLWSWTRFSGLQPALLLAALVGLFGPITPLRAQGTNLTVRIEVSAGQPVLVVPAVPARGILFIAAGSDLGELRETPDILFQTNTPLATEIRVPLPADGVLSAQGFLHATHWAGIVPALADIPAGTFTMGSPASEPERLVSEGPQTQVTLTRAFKMGRFELTQAEYRTLMGRNPSYFIGNTNRPVDQVSWTNAVDYCARLTATLRTNGVLPKGWAYRLPTEAEWEYACRADTTTPFGLGSALRSGMANFDGYQEYDAALGTQYNPDGQALYQSTVGGRYPANPWGLFDMHGNLWEWCLDNWRSQHPGGTLQDPLVASDSPSRVIRGGCWYTDGRFTRSATRTSATPGFSGNEMGFRVVLARE